ncbi:MAG: hypothetical protein IJC38_06380 [Erysipelotrichaceae bacterium]|nr:hypothetical protein [Erysipelotrichaceae bacterium]
MKKNERLFIGIGCLTLTILFMLPYLGNELSIEHDTLFHLSRIEGLAQSFQSGKLFPDIYPFKNDGFGYASALFYCDFFLVPAALLYNLGFEVAIGYKLTVFLATLLSAVSMSRVVYKLKHSTLLALFSSTLYLFSNYRITDVYVRGALGEIIAMTFIPLILLGAYELFYEEKSQIRNLIVGFTGLALSHNLTLLLGCFGFGALLLMNLNKMSGQRWILLVQAALTSIGLSAWFLFPMLEQTAFQEYYLHYYASSSDLASHALAPWQYLINETIFGISGNQLSAETAMVVTPGVFLLGLPVLSLFHIHKQNNPQEQFVQHMTWLGYGFAFLCSSIVPWEQLFFLRILQFPWRFMTLACCFLSISSAISFWNLFHRQKTIIILVFAAVIFNGVHLLLPALSRPLVIYNHTTYEELTNGSIIDPYFANTSYNRIEVAGADYLPIGFLDYKNASHCIIDYSGNEISQSIWDNNAMVFHAPKQLDIIAPLTAYKGYYVYSNDVIIPWKTIDGRISFNTGNCTQFTIQYQKTTIHQISIMVSFATILLYSFSIISKKADKPL